MLEDGQGRDFLPVDAINFSGATPSAFCDRPTISRPGADPLRSSLPT